MCHNVLFLEFVAGSHDAHSIPLGTMVEVLGEKIPQTYGFCHWNRQRIIYMSSSWISPYLEIMCLQMEDLNMWSKYAFCMVGGYMDNTRVWISFQRSTVHSECFAFRELPPFISLYEILDFIEIYYNSCRVVGYLGNTKVGKGSILLFES